MNDRENHSFGSDPVTKSRGPKTGGQAAPVLDAIIEAVLRGERIVIFPPGSFVFISANFASLLGSAVLFISTLQSLFSASTAQAAVAQLFGLVLAVLLTVIPGLLVALGVSHGRQIVLLIIRSLLGIAVLALVMAVLDVLFSRLACLVAVTLLAIAAVMVQSTSYLTYAVFRFRLRQRRMEYAGLRRG